MEIYKVYSLRDKNWIRIDFGKIFNRWIKRRKE